MTPADRAQQTPGQESSAEDSLLRVPKPRRKGPAERMWRPIKLELTPEYKYINNNIFMRLAYWFFDWCVMPLLYLFLAVQWGFQVKGRKNLRTVRGRSAVVVSNHVHNIDALMVTQPFWPSTPYIVARKHNLEVFLLNIFTRSMRAVPLPEDAHNFRHFSDAIQKLLTTTHKRLHVFPEGEIAPYARTLRPFGRGAFQFAAKADVPIVPMVFVSPAPHRLQLLVGEPIELSELPELEGMSTVKRARFLCTYTHDLMQKMLDDYYAQHEKNGARPVE